MANSERCTEILTTNQRCDAPADWVYTISGEPLGRGYACAGHLTAAEDRTPAAQFLPLNSENRR